MYRQRHWGSGYVWLHCLVVFKHTVLYWGWQALYGVGKYMYLLFYMRRQKRSGRAWLDYTNGRGLLLAHLLLEDLFPPSHIYCSWIALPHRENGLLYSAYGFPFSMEISGTMLARVCFLNVGLLLQKFLQQLLAPVRSSSDYWCPAVLTLTESFATEVFLTLEPWRLPPVIIAVCDDSTC